MNPDDPKFTAHALGELEDLTPVERAEIEALLASDPGAADEARETRALALRLRAELQGEAAAPLHDEQRAAVLGTASDAEHAGKLVRFPRRATVLAAIAACLVVSVSVALLFPAMQAEKEAARKSLATTEPAAQSDAGLLAAQSVVVQPPPLNEPVFSAPTAQAGELASAMPQATPSAPTIASITTSNPVPIVMTAPVVAEPLPAMPSDALAAPLSRGNAREEIAMLRGAAPEAEAAAQDGSKALSKDIATKVEGFSGGWAKGGTASFRRPLGTPAPALPVTPTTPTTSSESRADTIRQTELAWQRPIRRFAEGATAGSRTGSGAIEHDKLAASPSPAKEAVSTSALSITTTTATPFERGNLDTGSSVSFETVTDNAFLRAREEPLSTFSIDVDTASYAIVRRFLNRQQHPPKGAVRIEELLNYFTYEYPQPQGDAPFSATMEVAACPWTPEHRLVRIGLKGREIANDQRPASNLVFLIDVSGSMQPENKLPLLKQSLALLVDQLGAEDRVAMVVYAGSSGCVLEPTRDKRKMREALQKLEAGGSTNGGSGLQLAYKLAEKSFIKGGTNRVILATDGDWNVGITRQDELLDLIKRQAKSGVFLTVLGVGMDNLKDTMLVKLADTGNGNYAFLDTLLEAKKVLVDQLSSTLVTIAKDVKIQVEFNPAQVGAYRLIGYEKRVLAAKDFNDDKKDAGEIGAGHTVTALYEIVPAGKEMPAGGKAVDPLKYQPTSVAEPVPAGSVQLSGQAGTVGPVAINAGDTLTAVIIRAGGFAEWGNQNRVKVIRQQDGKTKEFEVDVGKLVQSYDAKSDPVLQNGDRIYVPRMMVRQETAGPAVAAASAGAVPLADAASTAAVADRAAAPAAPATLPAALQHELLTLKLRYKEPEGDTSKLLEFPLTDRGASWEQSSRDFRFAAAVAGYGLLLRDSPHKGEATWSVVQQWAQEGKGADASGYRTEFLALLEKAKALPR